jgi:hypothetical protein
MLQHRRAAVCQSCWRKLPEDMRDAISTAKRDKARHREATAAIAATRWLSERRPALTIARVTGELPADLAAPP